MVLDVNVRVPFFRAKNCAVAEVEDDGGDGGVAVAPTL
jgi:hypothetical protein